MLLKRQAFTCPCCGGFLGDAAPIQDVLSKLTGHRQTLVKALSTARGMQVSRADLISSLWKGAREPDAAVGTFHEVTSKTRKVIERYGWTIVSAGRGGDGGVYRLIPLEAGQ